LYEWNDEILVSFENKLGNIQKNGQLIGSIRSFGLNESLKYPCGLKLDSQGNLFIGDGGNGRIVVFDGFDRFISDFGQFSGGMDSYCNWFIW